MAGGHIVEALPGAERIRVEIGGRIVAESDRPVLVHETGMPVRYYLPPQDVALELFEPTATRTHCPFKGDASYWSYRDGEGRVLADVVWAYTDPLHGVALIKDHLCFYDTKARIVVDTPAGAG
ncbi:DUF427 domain-containing protein [Streptomyces sp. NPDC051776]|uniref:DUF427 domain-containing protein n=1 Tax=Streptomyces sp. NPDC051776 TaxID=3155414 RepID=UPI00344970EB